MKTWKISTWKIRIFLQCTFVICKKYSSIKILLRRFLSARECAFKKVPPSIYAKIIRRAYGKYKDYQISFELWTDWTGKKKWWQSLKTKFWTIYRRVYWKGCDITRIFVFESLKQHFKKTGNVAQIPEKGLHIWTFCLYLQKWNPFCYN